MSVGHVNFEHAHIQCTHAVLSPSAEDAVVPAASISGAAIINALRIAHWISRKVPAGAGAIGLATNPQVAQPVAVSVVVTVAKAAGIELVRIVVDVFGVVPGEREIVSCRWHTEVPATSASVASQFCGE